MTITPIYLKIVRSSTLTPPMPRKVPEPINEHSNLDRPLITLDGNLLAASWKGGCCIPDKLIDRLELLKELRVEVCRMIQKTANVEVRYNYFNIHRDDFKAFTSQREVAERCVIEVIP